MSGFRSCWGHCVVFLGKTLCSHNSLLSFNRHFMNQARRTRHFAEPIMQANCTMLHSAEECITDTSELIWCSGERFTLGKLVKVPPINWLEWRPYFGHIEIRKADRAKWNLKSTDRNCLHGPCITEAVCNVQFWINIAYLRTKLKFIYFSGSQQLSPYRN